MGDVEMLREVVPMLKQQKEKSQLDRNYVQLERDTIQTFYDITSKETKDLDQQVAAKDREMELMEDNHRVEVRVYLQKVKHLEYEHSNMAADYAHIEKERDELFNSFEASVKQVQQKTDFRNIVLDQKLGNMESSLENASVQVKQIVGAANLDPIEMEKVQASLDETLSARNQLIKDLRFALARVTKSYNDSLRSFTQKLTDLGIPTTEVDSMGFVPIPT